MSQSPTVLEKFKLVLERVSNPIDILISVVNRLADDYAKSVDMMDRKEYFIEVALIETLQEVPLDMQPTLKELARALLENQE